MLLRVCFLGHFIGIIVRKPIAIHFFFSRKNQSLLDGRTNGSKFEVAELDNSVGLCHFNFRWSTRCGWAWATSNSWLIGISIGWIVAVQPEHVDIVIIPDGHDKDHAFSHGLAHLFHTALVLVVIQVTEKSFSGGAHLVGDGIVGRDAREVRL
jgi:hypothetical protein